MSISDLSSHRSGADPAGALAEAVTAVRGLDQTWWTSQSDDVLVSVVEQVQALRSALAAVEAGAVAEADARDLAKHRLHHASTGAWLTHVGGRHRGEGRRLLARARALTGPLQATREALADGRVSPEQADVIVRSIDDLPLGEAVRARGELALIEHAGSLDASELARTGRHLAHVVDPDATASGSRPSWPATSAPPTTAATSPSPSTRPAASGSRAAGARRTAPCCGPPCCR